MIDGIFNDIPARRIEHWRRRCTEVGSESPADYHGAHAGGYLLQQIPEEFACWLSLVEACEQDLSYPLTYLEIGCAAGGSIRLVAEAIVAGSRLPDLYAIDPCQHHRSPQFMEWLASVASGESNEHAPQLHVGSSHDEASAQWLAERIDACRRPVLHCVFLDGDHTYAGLRQDFDLVEPHLAEYSLLGVHDLVTPHCGAGIQRAVNEVIGQGRFVCVGTVKSDENRPCGIAVLRRTT